MFSTGTIPTRRRCRPWFTAHPHRGRPPPTYRHGWERLEDRLAPATNVWWGFGPSSLWGDAANWSDGVPTPDDDVIIAATLWNFPTVDVNVPAVVSSLTFSAPALTLQILPGTTLTVNGPSSLLNGTVVLNGATWNGSGTIDNQVLFTARGWATVASPLLNHNQLKVTAGTLDLLGGGGSDGAVAVTAGSTLSLGYNPFTLSAGSTLGVDGTVILPNGGTLAISGGSLDVNPGAYLMDDGTILVDGGWTNVAGTLEGDGTIALASGVVKVNATSSVGTLNFMGGVLGGTAPLFVNGALNWTGGAMVHDPGGSLVVATGALGHLGSDSMGAGSLDWSGTFINFGATDWRGPLNVFTNGCLFYNGGSFVIRNDAALIGAADIRNVGSFVKEGGSGTTDLDAVFTNRGDLLLRSGTLALHGPLTQTGGRTMLQGGDLSLWNGMEMDAGLLGGNGTVFGSVLNLGGRLAPGASPGLLTIIGDYLQAPNGTYQVEIGGLVPGADYDQVVVYGNVTFAGTMTVVTLPPFQPQPGQTWTVMTYEAAAGDYGEYRGLNLPGGRQYVPAMNPQDLTLSLAQGHVTPTIGSPALRVLPEETSPAVEPVRFGRGTALPLPWPGETPAGVQPVTALSGALARDWWRNLRSGTAAADARQGGEDQPPAEVLRPTALFYQEPLEEGDESVAAFERLIRLAGGPQPVPATPAAAPETAAAAPAPVENVNVVDAVFADGARPWAVRLFVAGIAAALIAALAAERHRGRAAPPPAVGMAA